MSLAKDRKVVKFVYSASYEEVLIKLSGGEPSLKFFREGVESVVVFCINLNKPSLINLLE